MAITKRMRFVVLERDEFTCYYCKRSDLPLEVDHVIPKSLGGQDILGNLVAACIDCNRGKAANPVQLDQQSLLKKMKELRPLKREQLKTTISAPPTLQATTTMAVYQELCGRISRGETADEAAYRLIHKYPTDAPQILAAKEQWERQQIESGAPPPIIQKYIRDMCGHIGRGKSLSEAASHLLQKTGDEDGVRKACEYMLERQKA